MKTLGAEKTNTRNSHPDRNRNQATFAEEKCSRHFTNPAPLYFKLIHFDYDFEKNLYLDAKSLSEKKTPF